MTSSRPVSVMIVDDAIVVRGLTKRYVEHSGDVVVKASVGDGEKALRALSGHAEDFDVIILDIDMPRMDGMTALPQLLKQAPGIQILMSSTLTLRNAEISLKALSLGAADYLTKPLTSRELLGAKDFQRDLLEKVTTLGRLRQKRLALRASAQKAPPPKNFSLQPSFASFKPVAFFVGSSTGGPQALMEVMRNIGHVQQPIFITQHMPPNFTKLLADHITRASGLQVSEAKDGEVVVPAHVYVAPGDYHMRVNKSGGHYVIALDQGPAENFCRPAVDVMLKSALESYGPQILVVILTGMGSDGKKASELVSKAGGRIIAQDENSSVVWGMPGAVALAGLCSSVLPLDQIGKKIAQYATGSVL